MSPYGVTRPQWVNHSGVAWLQSYDNCLLCQHAIILPGADYTAIDLYGEERFATTLTPQRNQAVHYIKLMSHTCHAVSDHWQLGCLFNSFIRFDTPYSLHRPTGQSTQSHCHILVMVSQITGNLTVYLTALSGLPYHTHSTDKPGSPLHHGDVTYMLWCLRSLAIWLFIQQLYQVCHTIFTPQTNRVAHYITLMSHTCHAVSYHWQLDCLFNSFIRFVTPNSLHRQTR